MESVKMWESLDGDYTIWRESDGSYTLIFFPARTVYENIPSLDDALALAGAGCEP